MIDLERLTEAIEIAGMMILLIFVFVLGLWLSSKLTEKIPLWQNFLIVLILIGCLIIAIYSFLGV